MKVTTSADTGIVIQQARYDALGRRCRKVVTNSGDHDGTGVYYYKGHQIVETRDGSANLVSQVYHGTQYIDEVVGMRLPHGRAYVHQDANWNVTALTDLKGAVLERYYYSPYGQVEVAAETYFGDYDADGSVDSDDADDLCTNGCTCEFTSSVSGGCRVFDFDCDGDLDETDQNTLRTLYQGLSTDMQNRRIPSTTSSPTGNPFTHQGLVLDVEIGSYQNRARQYNPKLKRFMQRDPLGYMDGINLYGYVESRAVTLVDPFGLWTVGIGIGGSVTLTPVGVQGEVSAHVGFDWDRGWSGGVTATGGVHVGIGAAIGIGPVVTGTTAPTVDDLKGIGVEAAVDLPVGVSGSAIAGLDSNGKPTYVGVQASGIVIGGAMRGGVTGSVTVDITDWLACLMCSLQHGTEACRSAGCP